MKAKLFSKLKQAYSPLGLGDEILQGRADALARTGLVTDDNLDLVVAVQKDDLEALQKLNDRRVSDALEKQRAKAEEESRKKEEEAAKSAAEKKAAEEAAKAAEEEERKKAKEAAAAAKAAAEAEARRKEEEAAEAARIAKINEKATIPDEFLDFFKTEKEKAAVERKAYEQRIQELLEAQKEAQRQYLDTFQKLSESNKELKTGYETLRRESEEAQKAKAKADREAFILSKAKELGVPQWRIDEGFVIPSDMEESAIAETLAKTANNIRIMQLPEQRPSHSISDNTPTAEDIAGFAKSLVK